MMKTTIAGDAGGRDHELAVHCVQRLDHECLGELALDLLTETVVIADGQRGGNPWESRGCLRGQ